MSESFLYDVFLSHSSEDNTVVQDIAGRLRKDGLKVWFDEWEIEPGDNIPRKIEEGLEQSRVLVLCMSANAFGSDWPQLESGTFRFRDPLNRGRRFIPLRLDDAPIKGSLAQFLYIDWRLTSREQGYAKLLEVCRPKKAEPPSVQPQAREWFLEKVISLGRVNSIKSMAWSSDGRRALAGSGGKTLRLWDVETGHCLLEFEGHTNSVQSVAWSPDGKQVLSGSDDRTLRLWDVETGHCEQVFRGHTGSILSVAWSPDGKRALSGSGDDTVRLWDVETGSCLCKFIGDTNSIQSVAWDPDGKRALSGSVDRTLRLWDVETGRCAQVFRGHSSSVLSVAWSPNGKRVLSGSDDRTLRLWDVETGHCVRVFEGHTGFVNSVAFSGDGCRALSGSVDKSVRIWDVETGRCIREFEGHMDSVNSVAWSLDGRRAYSASWEGVMRIWNADSGTPCGSLDEVLDQVQYTNAKVLLVGDSGAGKTGLSKRLALNEWQPSDSTVGAWATQWKLPMPDSTGVEREIWLWDFGGQADQRLIHQLYMAETALAVLIFDGQKEDLFETLGQWDRDLSRASEKEFAKLLVAGRVDAGGLRVSRQDVERFKVERKFLEFLETSAKENRGCEKLKHSIIAGIKWDEIPCRTTKVLFKRLKDEIIRLKDEGRALMRFNELREALQLRLSREIGWVTDEELGTVLTLLAGPGVVWELKFGSWVLLQPEMINAYAQAVIRTLQRDEHQRGYLMEDSVLKGDLDYTSSMQRLVGEEEQFVLLAMHQVLVERGLCLREYTENGTLLIFPSYYRRERPELEGHPAVLVSYRFSGFLDEIYATLVVRLHHTKAVEQEHLWRYAADFKTPTGKLLGFKLERRAEGEGELVVYADPAIPSDQKITFSRYVHEHLLEKGRDVVRLRHYTCQHCGTQVGNRKVAMDRLEAWVNHSPSTSGLSGKNKDHSGKLKEPTILCVNCEKRIPLWDEVEQYFASDEVRNQVRQLKTRADLVLDNESKDRMLVGEVISTVALAGQTVEEYSAKRFGLDMEVEFKDDNGVPTGKKLYLQLKSGDSHLRKRSDGWEVFEIPHEDHADYWMEQVYPVFLVIANSKGTVRWMEIRQWLKRASENGKKVVRQIEFAGERFDVMSVRRWREKVLSGEIS